jgi:hypothetical protein
MVYSRTREGAGANAASENAKWQISFAIYATMGFTLSHNDMKKLQRPQKTTKDSKA